MLTRPELIHELKNAAADGLLSDKWRAILTQAAQLLDSNEAFPESDVRTEAGKFAMKLEGTPVDVAVEFIPRLLRSQGYEAGLRAGLEHRGVRLIGVSKVLTSARDSLALEVHHSSANLSDAEVRRYIRGYEMGAYWALRENVRVHNP